MHAKDARFEGAPPTIGEQRQLCATVADAVNEELQASKLQSDELCSWKWRLGYREFAAKIEFHAVEPDDAGYYLKKYGRGVSECLLYSEQDDREIFQHSSSLMLTDNGDFCAEEFGTGAEREIGGDFTLRRTHTFVDVRGWSGPYGTPMTYDELIPARDLIISVARKAMAGE